jgi:hypothetical protein
LTLREAICEHVFPLVDAPDREVRLKVGGRGLGQESRSCKGAAAGQSDRIRKGSFTNSS